MHWRRAIRKWKINFGFAASTKWNKLNGHRNKGCLKFQMNFHNSIDIRRDICRWQTTQTHTELIWMAAEYVFSRVLITEIINSAANVKHKFSVGNLIFFLRRSFGTYMIPSFHRVDSRCPCTTAMHLAPEALLTDTMASPALSIEHGRQQQQCRLSKHKNNYKLA